MFAIRFKDSHELISYFVVISGPDKVEFNLKLEHSMKFESVAEAENYFHANIFEHVDSADIVQAAIVDDVGNGMVVVYEED